MPLSLNYSHPFTKPMHVIVTGAVAWTDEAAIRVALERLPVDTVIIHGDCPGADEIAGRVGAELGREVKAMSKNSDDYRRYGKAAWMGLNERMLQTALASELALSREAGDAIESSEVENIMVLVFHPDLGKSRGARHMIDLAEAADIRWAEPAKTSNRDTNP